ncbi:MAG: tetratricopeptide repeat protein [Desulfobacteraceae bacterium]|nr:tetratricopeptide repeat protein [Desulfobacteraceae bacterium]
MSLFADSHSTRETQRLISIPATWQARFETACDLHAAGKHDAALAEYHRILEQKPDLYQAWFNQGLIRFQRAEWAKAIQSFQQAVMLQPKWDDAHFNLAQAYEQVEKYEEAIGCYTAALKLNPNYFEAAYNLGCLLLRQQRFAESVPWFERAVAIDDRHAPAHNNLGQALERIGTLARAEQCYAKAHQLAPDLMPAYVNLAELLAGKGELEKAVQNYREVLSRHPHLSTAQNNLGNIYLKQNRLDDAIECYRRVVDLEPRLAEGHFNLGSALRQAEIYEEAMASLLRAIQLKPDYADAWNNLALACKNIGDLDRSLTCFNRAIALDPELAVAHWNRSFVYLLQNQYLEGWIDFDWRFRIPQRKSIYPFDLDGPRWSGELVPHAAILIHDEQGLGDTIHMVRYLPMVKARCRRLILETRKELVPLLKNAAGIDQLIVRSTNGRPEAKYDFHFPLLSLPRLFRTTPETAPGQQPYLLADRIKAEVWRNRLPSSGMKIGLAWAGRPQHTNDRNRSCQLSQLRPILEMPGISFVGLQKGPATEQSKEFIGRSDFINLDAELSDFSDTAAVLTHIDLLITVDTAIAHLAGAMGKPVWVMIPFIPDWRWGMTSATTPWYPTMRLFRQPRPKDWEAVIQAMKKELEIFILK